MRSTEHRRRETARRARHSGNRRSESGRADGRVSERKKPFRDKRI